MSSLPAGAVISHYKISELIGRGGMGEVYKAVDQRLRRTVALKVPGPLLAGDERMRRRFLREAHTASLLSHPNICTIFEIGEEDGQPFIVMEYVEGRTLKEIISTPPPIEVTINYAIQIADALGEAHRRGVLHRDLKPSNIIVNRRGAPVLLDFGLAKLMREFAPSDEESPTLMQSLTPEASLVGTVAYMSPEQARGQALDARSDIFSFGVVLYEMLAGCRPFTGPSQIEVLHSILYSDPRPLDEIKPGLDGRLQQIVARAMKKDAAERYQSIEEPKLELWRLVKEKGYDISGAVTTSQPGAAQTGAMTVEMAGSKLRRLLRTPRVWWEAAAVLLMVIAVWAFWPRDRDTPPAWLSSLTLEPLVSWKSNLVPTTGIHARFSPDGKAVAYVSTEGGAADIWIKQISGEALVLRGTDDQWKDLSPIWSPDGEQIAFISNRSGRDGIWTIHSRGGDPAPVKTSAPGIRDLIAWSHDNKIYFDSNGNLFAIDLKSSQESQITKLDASHPISRYFSLAPTEDQVAFIDEQNNQKGIWTLSLKPGAIKKQVMDDSVANSNLVWLDNQRIIYISNRNSIRQIFMAFLDGRKPVRIPMGDSGSDLEGVSKDGKKILYSIAKDESDLWGVTVNTSAAFQVTNKVGVELWPDVSRDGEKIVFQAKQIESVGQKLDDCAIFTKPAALQGQSLKLAEPGFAPQWSPDGGRVAFLRVSNSFINLWTISVADRQPRQLTTGGILFGGFSNLPYNRFQTLDFQWSADGGAIIYCANRSGLSNVWKKTFDGSDEVKMSTNTAPNTLCFCPLWSPRGERIAYLAMTPMPDKKLYWSVWVIEGGQSRKIFQSDSVLRLVGWSPSGHDLFVKSVAGKSDVFSVLTPTAISLMQISINDGHARTLTNLGNAYFSNLFLSPDGQTIAFAARENDEDTIKIIPVTGGIGRRLASAGDPDVYLSHLVWSPDGKTIYFGKQTNERLLSIIDNFR